MPITSSVSGYSTPGPVVGMVPYINIQDWKTNGTAGGAFNSGAWRTRDLNTIVANVGGYAALGSNQISLSPGIYRCDITAPGWQVNDHVARLQNITTGTTIAEGVNGRSNGSTNHEVSRVRTYFSLTSLSVLEVQHQCETSNGTDGFGRISNFTTDNEIYTVAEFWKLDNLTTAPPVGDFTVRAIPPFPYVRIEDQKTQNTDGGTFTSGADQTRDLNTKAADTHSLASLSSNQVTLPQGTWMYRISAPAFRTDSHQAWLFNVTGSMVVQRGTSEYNTSASNTAQNRSWIVGQVTLSVSTALEVRHRATTTEATNGYGVKANFGVEVYTIAEFWKVA